MNRLVREPLFHFLLAGAALFAAYAWLNPEDPAGVGSNRAVHITAQDVDWLAQSWARQWQRPPDEQELRGLVTDYLKEQLLAREATELGLDKNDTLVRRRLAQKMEFLVQDTASAEEPAEEELQRFHQANHERFQQPARISFRQVYFTGQDAERRAAGALTALRESGQTKEIAGLGDRTLLAPEILSEEEAGVAASFGTEFAKQVFALEPDRWHGPIRSGYGLHLVRIGEKLPAQAQVFDTVRDKVLADWQHEQQKSADKKYFASLLKKYDVIVDESVKPLVGSLNLAQSARAVE